MPNRATVIIPANHLPEEERAALPEAPIPGTRYRIRVKEIEETDEEKLAALRTKIQAAIDDPRPSISDEVVFAKARARIEEKRRARLNIQA